jgi:serine O-acetyltransferase
MSDPIPPVRAAERPPRHLRAPPLPDGRRNENPPGMGFWALVREDLATHDGDWTSQGFWALFWHRFGNWRMGVRPKVLRLPLSVIYRVMFKATEIFCGIKLSYNVKVGRRVRIDHFGGIVLGARAIGNDVILRQNTTLGIASPEDLNAKPVLEDGVNVGAGAVIVGDIVIGRGSVIGANAVVTKSVPPFSLVLGVPGRVVRQLDDSQAAGEP